jgi:hypothetical protein
MTRELRQITPWRPGRRKPWHLRQTLSTGQGDPLMME